MNEIKIGVIENLKAKEGEPREWIDLKEIYDKVGYSYPYSRFAKAITKRFNIQPKVLCEKLSGAGRPYMIYFVPYESAKVISKQIRTYKHKELVFVKKVKKDD